MRAFSFRTDFKSRWTAATEEWDVTLGAFFLALGVIGLYIVQFTDFAEGDEQHQASETLVLGEVLKTLGDARMRYRESAVWRDLGSSFEAFEGGDSVFTSSSGFVSVRYKEFEPAQIYPNSLVVLTVGTRPGSKGKTPLLDVKKGKIKVVLNRTGKGPRVRSGSSEYEFSSKELQPGSSIELQVISPGPNQKTEIYSGSPVDLKIEELDPKKAAISPPEEIHLGPNTPYKSDQPKGQGTEQAQELSKSKEFKSQKGDVKHFIQAISQLKGDEKVKDDEKNKLGNSQLEEEVLKSLNSRLKKSGFNSKIAK